MATRFLEENPATEREMKAVYDQNLPRLSGQQQFKASHIFVDTQEEAEVVIKQLQQERISRSWRRARERQDRP